MTTVLLVRHGRTSANAGGTLAGRSPGVLLDDTGREQAKALAARLAAVPLAAVVTSPLERCVETAGALVADRDLDAQVDDRLTECGYGDWTGRDLKTLGRHPLWKVVQLHASAATFPGGESMRAMQARAVDVVRAWNDRLGEAATYAVVSHGDVIKAVLADALGLHLDLFQRLQVDPCSLSAVRYTSLRPFVVRLNDLGGSVADLIPPRRRGRRRRTAGSDATVGGGAGSSGPAAV